MSPTTWTETSVVIPLSLSFPEILDENDSDVSGLIWILQTLPTGNCFKLPSNDYAKLVKLATRYGGENSAHLLGEFARFDQCQITKLPQTTPEDLKKLAKLHVEGEENLDTLLCVLEGLADLTTYSVGEVQWPTRSTTSRSLPCSMRLPVELSCKTELVPRTQTKELKSKWKAFCHRLENSPGEMEPWLDISASPELRTLLSNLRLFKHHLSNIPVALGCLSALEHLCMRHTTWGLLARIGKLAKLSHFVLMQSGMKSIPGEMGTYLKHLHISKCHQLRSLPGAIGDWKRLATLQLSHCRRLSSLPHQLGCLPELTRLDIEDCSMLRASPRSIGNLTSLSELRIVKCSRLTLPSEIGGLSALVSLVVLGCSEFLPLPPTVGNLKNLSMLNLSSCLTQLPATIGSLDELSELTIISETITSLPDEIGRLPNLAQLRLHCKSLQQLPTAIGCFPKLSELRIRCQLQRPPDSIGNLKSLTKLTFFFCSQLSSLPDSVGGLTTLKELTMLGCLRFVTLPKTIGNLQDLRKLAVAGSLKVTDIPPGMGRLSKLTFLRITGCPTTNIFDVPQPPKLQTLHWNPHPQLVREQVFDILKQYKYLFEFEYAASLGFECELMLNRFRPILSGEIEIRPKEFPMLLGRVNEIVGSKLGCNATVMYRLIHRCFVYQSRHFQDERAKHSTMKLPQEVQVSVTIRFPRC